MNPRIPKVAHYYWHDGAMPPTLVSLVRRFLAINPAWRAAVWSRATIGPLVNQAAFDAADRIVYKSDVVRYEKLAMHGGHWRDCDVIPLRPIDPLLRAGVIVAEESPGLLNNGWWACEPGHPFAWRLVSGITESRKQWAAYSGNEQVGVSYFTRTAVKFPESVAVIPPVLVHPYLGFPAKLCDFTAHPQAFDVHFFNSNNISPLVQKQIDAGRLAIPELSDTSVNTRLFGMTPEGQTRGFDIAEAIGYAT